MCPAQLSTELAKVKYLAPIFIFEGKQEGLMEKMGTLSLTKM